MQQALSGRPQHSLGQGCPRQQADRHREQGRDLATGVPASLRSLDAVHVASARAIGDALDSLFTYDKRMLDVAREAGLAAFAPGVAD